MNEAEKGIFTSSRQAALMRARMAIEQAAGILAKGAAPEVINAELDIVQNIIDSVRPPINSSNNAGHLLAPSALEQTPESQAFAKMLWGTGFAEIPQHPQE